MMNIYHRTVGRNGVLELDVAVDETGRIPYNHAQRYQEMGDYIRHCYGTPLQQWTDNIDGYIVNLDLTQPVWTDRIMLREDQWRGGQRVLEYKIYVRVHNREASDNDQDTWILFSQGKSIGNKRIDFFNATIPEAVQIHALQFHALAARNTPLLREISVFAPCPEPSKFTLTSAVNSIL